MQSCSSHESNGAAKDDHDWVCTSVREPILLDVPNLFLHVLQRKYEKGAYVREVFTVNEMYQQMCIPLTVKSIVLGL